MSPLFGRRGRSKPEEAGDDPAPEEVGDGADESAAAGPYDAGDAVPAGRRIDLGALRIPVSPGQKLQVEIDKKSKTPRSATIVVGPSRVRLSAFAAPKSSGVWDDVRQEIADEVTKVGGASTETDGDFGVEVVTSVPTKLPDGRQAIQVQRFVGVDGPRWFLRAVFAGPEVVEAAGLSVPDGSADPARTAELEDVLRGVVVVRDSVARPPREPLPLTLPTASADADAEAVDADA